MRDAGVGMRLGALALTVVCFSCSFDSQPIAPSTRANGIPSGDNSAAVGVAGDAPQAGSGGGGSDSSSSGGASVSASGGHDASAGRSASAGQSGTSASAGQSGSAGTSAVAGRASAGHGAAGISASGGTTGSAGAGGSAGSGSVPFCMQAGNSGAACDDGLFCTVGEHCVNGTCEGGTARVCSLCSGSPPTCVADVNCNSMFCNEDTDACELRALNGTACEDGSFCTVADTCVNGVCQAGQPFACQAMNSQCSVGQCNEQTHACDAVPINEGMSCDDQNMCTSGEVCRSGACAAPEFSCPSSGNCTPSCPDGCTCSASCANAASCTPSCGRGSTCDTDCHGADTCMTPCTNAFCTTNCEDTNACQASCSGGTCVIDCQGANRCELSCSSSTTCNVDCRGVKDCSKIDCAGGACQLQCDTDMMGNAAMGKCQFKSCPNGFHQCANGIVTCNVDCPSPLPP